MGLLSLNMLMKLTDILEHEKVSLLFSKDAYDLCLDRDHLVHNYYIEQSDYHLQVPIGNEKSLDFMAVPVCVHSCGSVELEMPWASTLCGINEVVEVIQKMLELNGCSISPLSIGKISKVNSKNSTMVIKTNDVDLYIKDEKLVSITRKSERLDGLVEPLLTDFLKVLSDTIVTDSKNLERIFSYNYRILLRTHINLFIRDHAQLMLRTA